MIILINLFKSYCSNRHKAMNWTAGIDMNHHDKIIYDESYHYQILKADILKRILELLVQKGAVAIKWRLTGNNLLPLIWSKSEKNMATAYIEQSRN